MTHVTVHSIQLGHASLFSEGFGYDDDDNPIRFIGHTTTMANIKKDLDAALDHYGEGEQPEKPTIYLEAWQKID